MPKTNPLLVFDDYGPLTEDHIIAIMEHNMQKPSDNAPNLEWAAYYEHLLKVSGPHDPAAQHLANEREWYLLEAIKAGE